MGKKKKEKGKKLQGVAETRQALGRNMSKMGGAAPEAGLFTPEAGWTAPEMGRFSQEVGRSASEMGRFSPEVGRPASDMGRFSQEVGRSVPEMGRLSPEVGRLAPEMNRIVSEWVRKGDQGENNRVYLTGRLSGEAVFHHRNHGQRFYQVYLETRRKSGYTDRIPVLVPEFLLKEAEPGKGGLVEITGKFRSFSKVEEGNYHVLLKVAAATLVPVAARDFPEEENHIFLNGYICKQPVIRSTPLGRLIADFILAVNRESFRTDYIPCICWGRTARFAAALMVGEKVHLYGRIQSREYTKKTGEETTEVKTAYEVSVTNLELV